MYKCSFCGEVFSKPREYFDYGEFWGVSYKVPHYVSPCCGDDFEKNEEEW
jgi:ribosomal protein L32